MVLLLERETGLAYLGGEVDEGKMVGGVDTNGSEDGSGWHGRA